MYRQMSDLLERAADLFAKVPTEEKLSQDCYKRAGEAIETAAALLMKSISKRTDIITSQNVDNIENDK